MLFPSAVFVLYSVLLNYVVVFLALFYSVPICSVPFYSTLFGSVLLCSGGFLCVCVCLGSSQFSSVQSGPLLTYSVLPRCFVTCSVPFKSVLLCSIQFCSIPFVWFCFVLFRSILFYSILFHYILLYCVPFCSILLRSTLCFILFHWAPSRRVLFF